MRAPGTLSSPARALLQAVGRPVTRRRALGAAVAGGVVAAGALSLDRSGLAGTAAAATTGCAAVDRSAAERRVAFSNWVQYVDVDERDPERRPTLAAFTARTGIGVDYTEDVNDNNEFFGKIRAQLAACQDIERDLVVFTDWMAARFIRLGFAQPVDPARVATVHRNLLPPLRQRPYDRAFAYSIPWQSGLTGFAVNTRVAAEVHTVDELLTRPDLKGRVTVPMEMSDTMGLLIASLGRDPADFTPEDFDAALEKLSRAVQSGHIRRFSGNEYVQDLAKGDVAAAIAWSGDALQLNAEDEKVRFIAPDEGLLIWSDCALIPATARHGANAAKLLDHYYDPAVAAELAAWVNYVCPVVGAQEEMLKIDPELAEHELIFPSESTLAGVRAFKSLSDSEERAYQARFTAVMGM